MALANFDKMTNDQHYFHMYLVLKKTIQFGLTTTEVHKLTQLKEEG